MRLRSLSILLLCCVLFACKEKQKSSTAEEKTAVETSATPQKGDTTDGYFSVTDFFNDQWKTRSSDAYTLLRIEEKGGQRDSSYIPLDSAVWKSMRAYFDTADIGAASFMGRYKFDMFTDETTETIHFHYEAVDPELFMRKMDVSADMFTKLVKSVYMETRRTENGRSISRKMQYMPDRIFQIQTLEKGAQGPEQNTLLEYRYKY